MRDFLLQGEGVAGEDTGLEGGLAEGEGEGLVDFMVGETLGFAGEGLLFGGDGQGREGLDGLPGALVDEIAGGAEGAALLEKGHVRHRAAGPIGGGEAKNEEGCGDCNCQSAEILHLSTLHALRQG